MIVEASRIPPIHHRRLEIGRRIRNSSLRVVMMGSGIIFLKSRNYNNFLANQERIIVHEPRTPWRFTLLRTAAAGSRDRGDRGAKSLSNWREFDLCELRHPAAPHSVKMTHSGRRG